MTSANAIEAAITAGVSLRSMFPAIFPGKLAVKPS